MRAILVELEPVVDTSADDPSYLADHQAYIVFDVYDDAGNPLIYGPASRPVFDGHVFEIPWDVTSRIKSQRVEYQLYFISTEASWDPETGTWDELKTIATVSAKDGIAIRPSIVPKRGCCAPPPFLPSSTQPDVLGWIQFWQKQGLIGPVSQSIDEETGYPVLTFRTYSGEDWPVTFENIAGLVDGLIPIGLMPTSVQEVTDDVARLMGEVEAPETGLLDKMGAAEQDIDTLQSAVGTLQTEVEASGTGLLDEMDAVQTELTSQDGRLDALEATVDTPGTGLSAKVATLQTEVEAPSTGLISKVATLQTEVEASSTGLMDRMTAAEQDISSLDGRLDTVEPKVATLQDEVENPTTGLIKQVQDLQRLGLRYEVYQSFQDLPVPGSRNVLYLVRHSISETDNYYDEYLWVTNDGTTGVYELIGTTQFTLNITGDAYNVRLNGSALPNASSSSAGVITAAQFVQFSSRMARYEEVISLSRSGTNVIHDLGAIPVSVAIYVNNMMVRCRVDVVDTNTVRLKPTSDIAQARVIISI